MRRASDGESGDWAGVAKVGVGDDRNVGQLWSNSYQRFQILAGDSAFFLKPAKNNAADLFDGHSLKKRFKLPIEVMILRLVVVFQKENDVFR